MNNHEDTSTYLTEALAQVQQFEGLLARQRTLLELAIGRQPNVPYMDTTMSRRVEKIGEVAFRHFQFINMNDTMTRADSLKIRQEMYGENVQATANLFGTKNSGALFYRNVPFGSPVKDDDPICLTDQGTRIAELWFATHQN